MGPRGRPSSTARDSQTRGLQRTSQAPKEFLLDPLCHEVRLTDRRRCAQPWVSRPWRARRSSIALREQLSSGRASRPPWEGRRDGGTLNWPRTYAAWAAMAQDQFCDDTIWDRLEECVQYLSEPFRASEIVGWFRRHYPDVKEQSLRAHIQGATSNASAESRGMFANRQPLITRIEHGLYRRFDGDPAPAAAASDRHQRQGE